MSEYRVRRMQIIMAVLPSFYRFLEEESFVSKKTFRTVYMFAEYEGFH